MTGWAECGWEWIHLFRGNGINIRLWNNTNTTDLLWDEGLVFRSADGDSGWEVMQCRNLELTSGVDLEMWGEDLEGYLRSSTLSETAAGAIEASVDSSVDSIIMIAIALANEITAGRRCLEQAPSWKRRARNFSLWAKVDVLDKFKGSEIFSKTCNALEYIKG